MSNKRTEGKDFIDKYLRTTDGVTARAGLTAFDELQRTPGPLIGRVFEGVNDVEQKVLAKHLSHVMAAGAAVGLDETHKVVHYYPGRGIKFVGFLTAQTIDRATFKARGSAILKLEGVTDQDKGQRVYCAGPNEFSLKPQSSNDAEIGNVRFKERANFAAVAFKGEDDKRPLYLKLR